jgi:AcrR family transcriptional regulator
LAIDVELRTMVQQLLDRRWSPEQISHELRRSFPEQPERHLVPETIYQAIYVQGRGGLRRELHRALRTGRAMRRPRRGTTALPTGKIPFLVLCASKELSNTMCTVAYREFDSQTLCMITRTRCTLGDMDASAPRPLQLSQPERRSMLSRHFVGVVEQLVQNGTSYADLSVEAIITAGGISRSTFYVYFADKGDLLVAMAQDVIGDLVAAGTPWWELSSNATHDDLREALRVPVDTYRRHRTILATVTETAAYDPRVRGQQQHLVDQVVSALTSYIADAQRSGMVEATLDANRTAQWMIWMFERGLYQLIAGADDDETERLLDALTDIVWRVIYRR